MSDPFRGFKICISALRKLHKDAQNSQNLADNENYFDTEQGQSLLSVIKSSIMNQAEKERSDMERYYIKFGKISDCVRLTREFQELPDNVTYTHTLTCLLNTLLPEDKEKYNWDELRVIAEGNYQDGPIFGATPSFFKFDMDTLRYQHMRHRAKQIELLNQELDRALGVMYEDLKQKSPQTVFDYYIKNYQKYGNFDYWWGSSKIATQKVVLDERLDDVSPPNGTTFTMSQELSKKTGMEVLVRHTVFQNKHSLEAIISYSNILLSDNKN